ncbi:MAG: hypothetical protein GXX96_20775 [Planctomycetaceae bacterium]|nr:hypothetical protein [Planctomycetaceae bacterium]
MTVSGQTINIVSVERLIFDGENEDEFLTVQGAGGADRFTHTPGAARDAGEVTVDDSAGTLLAIEYVNLGLLGQVRIDGVAGNDTLVAHGTLGSDVMAVDFPASGEINVTLSSGLSQHVLLRSINASVESYEIRSLEGDDDVNVTAPVRNALSVFAGGPGAGSDSLNLQAEGPANTVAISQSTTASDDQVITGLGAAAISSSGVELITLTGAGGNDSLDVQLGDGDDTARIARGDGADVIVSSSLPTIEFSDLNAFNVTGEAGSNIVTFATLNLSGAVNTNYTAALGTDDTLVIEGADGAADAYTLIEPGAGQVQVDDGNGANVRVTGTGMGRVQVNTLGGDDALTVDNSGGLIDPLLGYDGGTGSDTLTVTGSLPVTNATYTPGPAVTEGRLTHDTQTIDFANLEPVIDLTVAGLLTINATDADNAIDYRDSGGLGLVSVDGFEWIAFNNKTDVILDGGAGSDAIHVDAVTSGFIGILFVNGDQPAVSGDTLTVTGALASVTVDHTFGTVTGAGPSQIIYGTIEGLTVNAGAATQLAFTGAAAYTVNPGAETDQGTVLSSGVPVSFDGFGTGATIDLVGSGVVTATINGTSDDDAFTVADNGIQNDVTIAGRATVEIGDFSTVTLNGYEGDDTFIVDGQNGLAVLNLHGGDGDDDDLLDANTPSGAVAVDLGSRTITGYGATINYTGLQTVDADAGMASPTFLGTSVDDDVTVTVYDADSGMVQHGYAVQRAGQVAGEIADPVIYYRNTDGNAANFDLGDGEDTLIVIGSTFGTTPPATDAPQVFDVNASDTPTTIPGRLPDPIPARQVRIDNDNDLTNDGIVTWVADGIESLEVWGLEGDDTFNVVPGPIPVFIDGGDPIGTSPGDVINIISGGAVLPEDGPEPDEGGFVIEDNGRVSYDHIEALGVIGAAKAIIYGTGDDDEITIIARDDSTHPGTDGVQDFTTTVNDGPEITWIDTPLIFVDAASGDDDVTLRTPAPNLAVWDVDVFAAGGPASTPEVGDRLRVETPYEQNFVDYQPTAPDAGIMDIYNHADKLPANLHSTIRIGSWDLIHEGLEYWSSPGGVETLLYDGISAEGSFDHDNDTDTTNQDTPAAFNDHLTVLGDGFAQALSDDQFVHTPGSAPDAGSVAMFDLTNEQTMLGISYNNIGLLGTVTIDGREGSDSLVAVGTGDSDVMEISFALPDATEIVLHNAAGTHVSVIGRRMAAEEFRTLEGDDEVRVDATNLLQLDTVPSLAVFGGGPSGSDSFFLAGAAGTTENVTIRPDAANPLDQDVIVEDAVTFVAAQIDVSGVELIAYAGADADDLLTVDPGQGDHSIRVDNGPSAWTDRVRSESLPEVQFTGLGTFLVAPTIQGIDVVTFVTRALGGAVNYHANLSAFDTLVIEGREGADDDYTLTHPTGANVVITDNNAGVSVTEVDLGLPVAGLRINTLGGDDLVTVDVGGDDLISVPIEYNGGGGSDTLIVSGSPVTGVDEVIYAPGPATEDGRLVYEDLSDTTLMLIDFVNLEPVIDLVPAATLTVLGTNGNNAISFTESPTMATWGMVTVDAYESIEFAGKAELILNARGGDDVISLNNESAVSDLDTIRVDGDDPTASDVVIVNGTTGSDTITIEDLAVGAARVSGAQADPVYVTNAELLVVDGNTGDDDLTVVTPAGYDQVDLLPGATADTADLTFRRESGNTLLPLRYENIGSLGTVTLLNDGGGREDDLTVSGRSGANARDVFTVTQTDVVQVFDGTSGIGSTQLLTVPITAESVQELRLNGLAGDDVFVVPGNHAFTAGVVVDGGEPAASDELQFVGSGGDITVELVHTPANAPFASITENYPVYIVGIENVEIDGAGAALTVNATADDDEITYRPETPDAGRFQNDGDNTVYNFTDVDGDFTINGSTYWSDHVIVEGTNAADVLYVDSPARTVTVEDVTGTALKPVLLGDSVEVVTAAGRLGRDTILVVPHETVGATPTNNLRVNVDGGQPSASDALVIAASVAGDPLPDTDFVVINHSRRVDEGVVRVFRDATGAVGDEAPELATPPIQLPDIGFVNIEVVSPMFAPGTFRPNLLVLGPDMYEQNEFINAAANLGSGDSRNFTNLAIFPNVAEHPFVPADIDWYVVKAKTTGTLDIEIAFEIYNPELLPGGGQIGIQVIDSTGTVIAGDGTEVAGFVSAGFGAYDPDANARVRFPAIAGQQYYFRVFGQTLVAPFVDDGYVVNGYDMTIINEAAPVPYDIELADIIGASDIQPGALLNLFTASASDTLSPVDDFYNGKYVYFLTGNLAGKRALISNYVAATRQFSLMAGYVSEAPINGTEFVVETHDSGRSQLDDVTRDVTPVIRFRLDDANLLYDLPGNTTADGPIDESIRIPFNPEQTLNTSTPGYRVAVFIEGDPQQPDAEPQILIGYARPIDVDGDGIPDGIYEFDFQTDAIDLGNPDGPTTSFPLTDGSHFISAKVQIVNPDDPDDDTQTLDNLTAFGARSVSHEIVVDTVIPPVWFGDPVVVDLAGTPNVNEADGLHPESDSGVEGLTRTLTDKVTNVTTPTFWGMAEADTLVRLYVDLNHNATLDPAIDLFIGETVAVPLDGTNQFPTGQWQLTSNVDFNDPRYFPARDGVRTVFATTEDLAGNVTEPAAAEVLQIFIDTRGPQIADPDAAGPLSGIYITDDPTYDLFDPKPSTDGPTPLANALTINFRDLPSRILAGPAYPEALLNWQYEALASVIGNGDPSADPGNFQLVGDANGIIPILRVELTNNPLGPNVIGTVAGGLTPGGFRGDPALAAQSDFYEGQLVRFTSGVLDGQTRVITGYDGDVRRFTFDIPFSAAPAVGDNFVIFPAATATINLVFRDPGLDGVYFTADDLGAPLPDDRFTLTISDSLVDPAGNQLDGESNTSEPQESPHFPSGDGVPGGDFVARFTVDSRPEMAAYAARSVWADTNGNEYFDPENLDYTNRDITYTLGFTSDDLFVGNFAGIAGSADGFDKLAAYGRVPVDGFRWLVDTDNDGVPNLNIVDALQLNGLPVAGNFDGVVGNGDEVGLYTAATSGGSVWYFDTNHDFSLDAASEFVSDLHGVPFVGDFNHDGLEDLGTWQGDTFYIDLGPWDNVIEEFRFGFIGVREKPVVADMDQDGFDDLGLWVPDRAGMTPGEGCEWYILVSDGASVLDRMVWNADLDVWAVEFTPVPFGPDLFMQFGDEYAMPLLGNFDPPVAASDGADTGVLQIDGTDGDDEFSFNAGTWTVTLNGVVQNIPAGTESIVFNGMGGFDTAFLRGSDGDDVFVSSPSGATLSGAGFTVTTQDVEVNHGYGMGGNDTATLNDSAGNDKFKSQLEDDYAKMYGGGYYTRAKFFENVTAVFSDGNDYARVWDSKGDDEMTASPAGLQMAGGGFNVNVEGFDRLLAYSTHHGVDTVNLYDSDGNDVVRARNHKTLFWGPGFDMTFRRWEKVVAHSENGGYDVAKFHDTLGDDVVLTGNQWTSLSTLTDGELDAIYTAYGFDLVKAYHTEGHDKSPDPATVDFLMLDDANGWDLQ